jgi:CRISPR-associated protein Csh2
MTTITEKSEILFLYETKYSMPNGDPFTGEQRYDEESKRILVSDVRIKRFVRDYFIQVNETSGSDYEVYVINTEKLTQGEKESGSAVRINFLANKEKFKAEFGDVAKASKKNKQEAKAEGLLKKCIDVRLFGGISTKEGAAVNITGPVQFALLNPALNQSDLRIHQNTSVFSSSEEKSRGAIGTTSIVPYSLCQIHGWVNPFSAKYSGLEQSDLDKMFAALWHSINNANTRSKSNQASILLVQIVYSKVTDKIYGTDKLFSVETQIKNNKGELISDKADEQIRDWNEFKLNLERLKEILTSDKVKAINYYTEDTELENQLKSLEKDESDEKKKKLKKMELISLTPNQQNK